MQKSSNYNTKDCSSSRSRIDFHFPQNREGGQWITWLLTKIQCGPNLKNWADSFKIQTPLDSIYLVQACIIRVFIGVFGPKLVWAQTCYYWAQYSSWAQSVCKICAPLCTTIKQLSSTNSAESSWLKWYWANQNHDQTLIAHPSHLCHSCFRTTLCTKHVRLGLS